MAGKHVAGAKHRMRRLLPIEMASVPDRRIFTLSDVRRARHGCAAESELREHATHHRRSVFFSEGGAAATFADILIALAPGSATYAVAATDATIVTPAPDACQFVESENGLDLCYVTTRKADYEATIASILSNQSAAATPPELKPECFIFPCG